MKRVIISILKNFLLLMLNGLTSFVASERMVYSSMLTLLVIVVAFWTSSVGALLDYLTAK
jgi:hypothetical protein